MKPYILLTFIAYFILSSCKPKEEEMPKPKESSTPVLTLVSIDSMRITFEPGDPSIPFPTYRNFRLLPDTLLKDRSTSNLSAPSGEWSAMSEDNRKEVQHLLTEVPENLLNIKDTTYHNSASGSCKGSTTIRAYKNGIKHTWYFPNCKNGVPDSVVEYATKSVTAASYLYNESF